MDVVYMPRKNINFDKFLKESVNSIFEFGMPIPMYLKSFSGYDNGMELLSKFGLRNTDEITLVVSRSEFIAYYAPFIKGYYDNLQEQPPEEFKLTDTYRPKEGDLLYFPFDGGIFEIKYVLLDVPFFQFGVNFTYELQCEKFEYSGEVFDTKTYPEIDLTQNYTQYYQLEFDVESATGVGTFQDNEDVTVYNLSPLLESGELPSPEDIISFSLYERPGFLESIDAIGARVAKWNKPNSKLVLTSLSNSDPLRRDENQEVTEDKLERVLIIGSTTGAMYISTSVTLHQTYSNDDTTIQDEFQTIQILDEGDDNEFGFV